MWNNLDLQCPATDIVEYLPEDSCRIEILRDFVTVLTTAADTLTSENPLWKEMNIFQNIQAKYKRILRCDKSLIYLQRVTHCLKKMVLLNLSKSYLDLAERFLVGFQGTSMTPHLPARQQLEYVLIRTQSAAKLMCEAIRYSRDTFCFLIQKLKVGHLILDLVMAASVTARLHIMLKGILVQICGTYQEVHLWRYKLKLGEHNWLETINLPLDLEKWLAATELGLMKPIPMSKVDAEILMSAMKSRNGGDKNDADSITVSEPQQNDQDCFVVDGTGNIDYGVSEPWENDQDCFVVDETGNIDYGEVIPRRKGATQQPITCLSAVQNIFLRKLISAQSFAELEDIWRDIHIVDKKDLLITLTVKKKRIIGKFLLRVQKKLKKQEHSSSKKDPKFRFRAASMMLAKYLGFTQDQINFCKSNSDSSSESTGIRLQPVKTFKKLKVLYKQLSQNLQSANRVVEHQKLKKIFKQRTSDIKLLLQNGENEFAKKLIKCTSKVFLTLYEK